MGDLSNIWLIMYVLAWAIVLICYQKRRRIFDGGSILILSYFAYAVLSYLLYNSKDGASLFKELTFFPFVYLFIMLLLAMSPVLTFDGRRVKDISEPPKRVIRNVALLFIIPTIISLPHSIQHISEGLTLILLDTTSVGQMVDEGRDFVAETGHGGLQNIPVVLSAAFYEIGTFLFFFLLLKREKKSRWLIVFLGIGIVLAVFSSLASGSRGGPIGYLLIIAGTYFMLKHFYSDKLNKIVKYIGVILCFIILIPIIAITIGRFGEDNSSSSALFYTGQSNLYFNNYALDDNGIRYGDRTIPLFKRMIGFSNVPHNFVERRKKYPNLKINDEVFSTFVGDFAIDFGPILAFLIFLFGSIMINYKTRMRLNGVISFRQLLLLHLVLCICINGGVLFNFADTGGNLKLIAYFIVYLYSSVRLKPAETGIYSNSREIS